MRRSSRRSPNRFRLSCGTASSRIRPWRGRRPSGNRSQRGDRRAFAEGRLMPSVSELRVKLFADGADLRVIETMAANPQIKGFTTNPTLMRKAGVADYEAFARAALAIVPDRPISFEVFSDDFEEMAAQAAAIASWGAHVFVKIPVTNTKGEFAGPLIAELTAAGVQVNVTAVLTGEQGERVAGGLGPGGARVAWVGR